MEDIMRWNEEILAVKVKLLNTVTGNPIKPYIKTENGYQANVGNYSVEHGNGYYTLVQTVGESGGQRVLTSGSRGAIVQFIDAYIQGYNERR
jgi:hypothetical protein